MSTENNGLPTSEETEEFFRKGNDYDRLQSELDLAKDELNDFEAFAYHTNRMIAEQEIELEKAKADVKSYIDISVENGKKYHMVNYKLESILAKQPVNADMDAVVIGMHQWAEEYQVFAFEVVQIRKTKNGYELREKGGHNWWSVKSCYSSSESCRKSIEGGEA